MMYLFSIYTFKGIKVFLYPNSILSFRKFLGIVAARLMYLMSDIFIH